MIYLAGPIDYVEDGHTWREQARKLIRGAGLPAFDPAAAFTNGDQDPAALQRINEAALGSSSVVLARVNGSEPSWGTPIEIERAKRNGSRVILWTPEGDVPPYLQSYPRWRDLDIAVRRAVEAHRLPRLSVYEEPRILATGGGIHAPQYGGDVGYDLTVMEEALLEPGDWGWEKIPIGNPDTLEQLHIALDRRHWATIHGRSSLVMEGLLVAHTVIDPGYRGPIFVFVANLGSDPMPLAPGERAAQLIIHDAQRPELGFVEQLPNSERGVNGFGSTGRSEPVLPTEQT